MRVRNLIVGAVATLIGVGALSTPAQAAEFDPASMCPSASPRAAQLKSVFAELGKNTSMAKSSGYTQSTALRSAYTWDFASQTVDPGTHRSLFTVDTSYLAQPKVGWFHDTAADQAIEMITQDPNPVSAPRKQRMAGLAALRTDTAWVAHPRNLEDQDLMDEHGYLSSSPLSETYEFTRNSLQTFSCSVTGNTMKVRGVNTNSTGAFPTQDLTVAVDDRGAVVYVKNTAIGGGRTGIGNYVFEGSASFGPQIIAPPAEAMTESGWNRAVTTGIAATFRSAAITAATAAVQKTPTPSARITAVQNAVAISARNFLAEYDWTGAVSIQQTKAVNGVTCTVSYNDGAPNRALSTPSASSTFTIKDLGIVVATAAT